MTDITARLRGYKSRSWGSALKDVHEAADEIERLRDTLIRQSAAHHAEVQEQTAADTALLRQAMEALQATLMPARTTRKAREVAIAALRERLKEQP